MKPVYRYISYHYRKSNICAYSFKTLDELHRYCAGLKMSPFMVAMDTYGYINAQLYINTYFKVYGKLVLDELKEIYEENT